MINFREMFFNKYMCTCNCVTFTVLYSTMLMFAVFLSFIVRSQSIFQNVPTCFYPGQLEVVNKIFEINGKGNFTGMHILLSPCGNYIPSTNCNSAKACLINRKRPDKSIKNAGLHYVLDPTYGNNVLRSVGGQPCSDNKNFTVFIKFECTSDTPSEPSIVNKTECELHVTMMMLECKVNCIAHTNKQVIDLRSSKNLNYTVNDSSNTNKSFALSICDTPSQCDPDVFVCEIIDDNSAPIATISTQKFDYDKEKYALIITGAVKHQNNKKQLRKTEISLTCNWNVKGISNLQYIKLPPSSKIYKFKGQSSAACIKMPMNCIVKSFRKPYIIYNLTTLNNSSGWKVNNTKYVGEIYLNICGPLILNDLEANGDCLDQYSQICYKDGARHFLNLGSISGNFDITPEETIKINFVGGSTCNENRNKTYSTEIELICNSTENGPALIETNDCVYTIKWKTPAACSRQFTTGDECKLSDVTGNFNLNNLKTPSDRNYTINKTSFILFNICTPLKSKCNHAKHVGVCFIKNGHEHVAGYWSSTLTRNNVSLSLHMKGDKCNGNIEKESTTIIYFYCNESILTEHVQINMTEDGCDIKIHIYSPKACVPSSFLNCKISSENTIYDLSPLIRNDTNYEVSDETDIILINVCRSVINKGDLLCPQNAAVCKIKTSNFNIHHRYESLGSIDSGNRLSYKDGNIILHYSGVYCFLGGVQWSIKINFQCSQNETKPEIVNKTSCSYEFMWKTKYACEKMKCSYLHSDSGRSIDFGRIIENSILNIPYNDLFYIFNICDSNYTCCIDKGTECTGYQSSVQLLKNENSLYYLQYILEKQCVSKITETNILRIDLKCNNNSKNGFDDSVHAENSTFSVNYYTNAACLPQVFLTNMAPQLRSNLNDNLALPEITKKIKTTRKTKLSVNNSFINNDMHHINQTRTTQNECKKKNTEKLISDVLDLIPEFSVTSPSNILYTINQPSLFCNGYICKNGKSIVFNKLDCPEVQVDYIHFWIKLMYTSSDNSCGMFHTELRIKCNSTNSLPRILQENDCSIIIEYPHDRACSLFHQPVAVKGNGSKELTDLFCVT